VVRTINPTVKPASTASELTLKLARRCVDVIGSSSLEEESSARPLNTGVDEDVASIAVGKEFSLVRTSSGRVMKEIVIIGTHVKLKNVRMGL